jgi:hypothetical protein
MSIPVEQPWLRPPRRSLAQQVVLFGWLFGAARTARCTRRGPLHAASARRGSRSCATSRRWRRRRRTFASHLRDAAATGLGRGLADRPSAFDRIRTTSRRLIAAFYVAEDTSVSLLRLAPRHSRLARTGFPVQLGISTRYPVLLGITRRQRPGLGIGSRDRILRGLGFGIGSRRSRDSGFSGDSVLFRFRSGLRVGSGRSILLGIPSRVFFLVAGPIFLRIPGLRPVFLCVAGLRPVFLRIGPRTVFFAIGLGLLLLLLLLDRVGIRRVCLRLLGVLFRVAGFFLRLGRLFRCVGCFLLDIRRRLLGPR